MTNHARLPKTAWRKVYLWTAIIIGGSAVLSDVASTVILDILGHGINTAGIVAATLMPILLGGPLMFYQALRHQQLRHLNAQLDILASTDWLTDCLNRRAFTAAASARLSPDHALGTLLIIDVDHFKAVNDRFGHDAGDEALQLLARTIKTTVESGDVVGRLGGEEFGVLLPGADFAAGLVTAERIRFAVSRISFAPAGQLHPLTVSIGGAVAVGGHKFADLLRTADQQLYGAKASGRNRIELVRVPAEIDMPANGNTPAIDKTALSSL